MSGFAARAATRIKSIQRGSVSTTPSANIQTGTVTVSEVDPSKSILIVSTSSGVTRDATEGPAGCHHGCELTNSTTLSWRLVSAYNTNAFAAVLYWQLVEYY